MNRPTAKFLFDHDFMAPKEAKPTVALAAHQAALTDAEAAGYRRGFEAGKAEAAADTEQRAAKALERIVATLDLLAHSLAAVEARLETEAVAVAVAVAGKLTPALIEREPQAEILALARDCFRHLVAVPHVVVRVSEAQHAALNRQIEAIVRDRGLSSHLVVLAEPEIQLGDCRIEWADGGVTRDRAATAAAIDEAVGRYIHARLAATDTQDIPRRTDR